MKKFYNWALILVTILTTGFTLTSCDEDAIQANYLDGEWRGDFKMYYKDRFGYEWDATYSIIEFHQNGFGRSGWGQQYDYYRRGPYEYQYYRFNWTIRDGVIYLSYPADPNLNTEIYDYQMSNYYFSGYFGSSHSYFSLEKYSNFNWSGYSGDYDYYYPGGFSYGGYYYDDYYYYYAKTRSSVDNEPASKTEAANSLVVERGRRANKQVEE